MSVIILDQFTDSADTTLPSHTIAPTNTPATSWSNNGGSWLTHTATAYNFSGSFSNPATLDAGVSDCTITCDLVLGGTAASTLAGVAFRVTDGNNLWAAWIRGDTNQLVLTDRTAGSNSTVDSQSYTVPTSTTVQIQVTLSGTSISATVVGSGVTVSTTSSTRQAATLHGLSNVAESGDVTKWDNFTVDDGGGGGGSVVPQASYYNQLLRAG